MSWIRVAKYSLVLFAATAVAAFPVGFVEGSFETTADAQTERDAAPVLALLAIFTTGATGTLGYDEASRLESLPKLSIGLIERNRPSSSCRSPSTFCGAAVRGRPGKSSA